MNLNQTQESVAYYKHHHLVVCMPPNRKKSTKSRKIERIGFLLHNWGMSIWSWRLNFRQGTLDYESVFQCNLSLSLSFSIYLYASNCIERIKCSRILKTDLQRTHFYRHLMVVKAKDINICSECNTTIDFVKQIMISKCLKRLSTHSCFG